MTVITTINSHYGLQVYQLFFYHVVMQLRNHGWLDAMGVQKQEHLEVKEQRSLLMTPVLVWWIWHFQSQHKTSRGILDRLLEEMGEEGCSAMDESSWNAAHLIRFLKQRAIIGGATRTSIRRRNKIWQSSLILLSDNSRQSRWCSGTLSCCRKACGGEGVTIIT